MGQTSESQAFIFLQEVSRHYPIAPLSLLLFLAFSFSLACFFVSPPTFPGQGKVQREERVIMLGMSAEDGL